MNKYLMNEFLLKFDVAHLGLGKSVKVKFLHEKWKSTLSRLINSKILANHFVTIHYCWNQVSLMTELLIELL